MQIFGINLSRTRAAATLAQAAPVSQGGWFPIVREPYTGAWQHNAEIAAPSVLAYGAVFSCVTLIAADIGKLRLRLVQRDDAGVWTELESPAFSPVLRRPNRYQIINKFIEQWMCSKLSQGNAYALKQRDQRGLVTQLYVLDPHKVRPLIAPDGAVYYELGANNLAGIPESEGAAPIVVPAREIVHDLMCPLFHPLIGVTPLYACGLAAMQGLTIQNNATRFFANGSNPGGILLAPGELTQAQADKVRKEWEEGYTGANVGKVGLLTGGLKYEALTVNAADAQLIEQLKWSVEQVCSCYHVPAALIDSSHQPPYANSEPLVQQYYSQCLQSLIIALENSLDEGLELGNVEGKTYGTEFDIDDLIWLDVATRTKAAGDAVTGGVMSPNESRFKYFGLSGVPGGESPYLQQQNFSLAALAERDADQPFSKAAAPSAAPPSDEDTGDEDLDLNRLTGIVWKGITSWPTAPPNSAI